MSADPFSRRQLFTQTASAALAASAAAAMAADAPHPTQTDSTAKPNASKGDQRLSVAALQKWEALSYGMFIHFGMSTFVANELPDGKAPATTYAPDKLDVDQWVSVARDAGMKYAVLTTKHVAGHCLWPTKLSSYSVVNSTNKTDVCEAFVKACEKRGVAPGFYYCSWDNHNRFGSVTPSDPGVNFAPWPWAKYAFRAGAWTEPPNVNEKLAPYTTAIYQNFQTAQIRELLTQYGRIAEVWIDIPPVLGVGYRRYLYEEIARLQPQTVIMMNSGISDATKYDVDYAWPSDIIALERSAPAPGGYQKWREIEGGRYYMPGEVCDPIGKEWFWVEGDKVRSDEALLRQYEGARAGGVNLLLDVPPDRHGLIPDTSVQALKRLARAAKLG